MQVVDKQPNAGLPPGRGTKLFNDAHPTALTLPW
jgi:hypothetical protein